MIPESVSFRTVDSLYRSDTFLRNNSYRKAMTPKFIHSHTILMLNITLPKTDLSTPKFPKVV
jgi:hypothetical protein